MLRKPNETVFQLSLTELAFVLTFVVLLLIGSKFLLVDRDKLACEKERDTCYAQLPAALGDPKQAIDSLVNAPKLRAENERLKNDLENKEAQAKALEFLKKDIPNPVRTAKALAFLKGYEESAGKELSQDEAQDEGNKAATLQKELENCRGQLKHCVTVTGVTKGYGLPPCWTNSAGQIEYLFEAEIRGEGIKLSRAWPDNRMEDAERLQARAIVDRGILTLAQFKDATRPIFDTSRRANPECRHYVILKRDAALRDLDKFNTNRLGVEDVFYKLDKTGVAAHLFPGG